MKSNIKNNTQCLFRNENTDSGINFSQEKSILDRNANELENLKIKKKNYNWACTIINSPPLQSFGFQIRTETIDELIAEGLEKERKKTKKVNSRPPRYHLLTPQIISAREAILEEVSPKHRSGREKPEDAFVTNFKLK